MDVVQDAINRLGPFTKREIEVMREFQETEGIMFYSALCDLIAPLERNKCEDKDARADIILRRWT